MMVVVGSLLISCSPANSSAGVITKPEDTQQSEQGEITNAAETVPEAGPAESADSTPMPDPEGDQPVSPIDIHCTETDPHPIGQSIADTYQVTYEEVMTFFCTGVGFDDIVLAYQTAELSGRDVKDVLTLWYDFGNWDDVWGELGLE